MKLAELPKDSAYKLAQFTRTQITALEVTITTKATEKTVTPHVVCLVRKKVVKLTPEEAVRQLYVTEIDKRKVQVMESTDQSPLKIFATREQAIAALERAAERARLIAAQTGTLLVTVPNNDDEPEQRTPSNASKPT